MSEDFKKHPPLAKPLKPEVKETVKPKKESELIQEKMDEIQKAHGDLLSNIPAMFLLDSEYWALRNEFMKLTRSGK